MTDRWIDKPCTSTLISQATSASTRTKTQRTTAATTTSPRRPPKPTTSTTTALITTSGGGLRPLGRLEGRHRGGGGGRRRSRGGPPSWTSWCRWAVPSTNTRYGRSRHTRILSGPYTLPFVQTLTNGLEWLKRSSLHNIFVSFLSYVNMQRIWHSQILRDR